MRIQRIPCLWAALLAALAAVLGSGCREPAGKPPPPAAKVAQSTVTFPKGSLQVAAITTAEVEPRGESVYRFNGRVVWDEEKALSDAAFGLEVVRVLEAASHSLRLGGSPVEVDA